MKITLTQPHEHGGRRYPAGATLELDADAAAWLIALGAALAPTPTPTPTPEDDAVKPAGRRR